MGENVEGEEKRNWPGLDPKPDGLLVREGPNPVAFRETVM